MCNLMQFQYSGTVVKKRQYKNNTANFRCKTCISDLRAKIDKGSRDEIMNFLLNLTSCGYETAAIVRRYAEKKAQSKNKDTNPQVKDEYRAGAIHDSGGSLVMEQGILEKEREISTPSSRTPPRLSDKVIAQGGTDLLEQEPIICVKTADPFGSQDVSADDNISRGPIPRKKLAPQNGNPDNVSSYSAKIPSTSHASIRKKQSIEHKSDAILAARLQAEFYRESRPRRSGN